MSDDIKTKYRVRMFCPLNFYRGTVEPAPEGYGLQLVSQEFETFEEARREEMVIRSTVASHEWTFMVEKVFA